MQQITDGQVHIWDATGDKAPSPSGRQEPLPVEELLEILDANGVARAVLVPPSWAARGNAYSIESAQTYPNRFKVLALLSRPGEDQADAVEALLANQGVAGLRMFLSNGPGADYLASGGADWLWPLLAAKGVPVAVHAGGSLPELAAAAKANPDLKLCLDAFGLGRGGDPSQLANRFEVVVETLSAYDNVTIKTGAIPKQSGDAFPFSNAQALVRRAYDTFGPDRIMYASDLTLLRGPYAEGLAFWDDLDFISEAEREKILGRNINEWLAWP